MGKSTINGPFSSSQTVNVYRGVIGFSGSLSLPERHRKKTTVKSREAIHVAKVSRTQYIQSEKTWSSCHWKNVPWFNLQKMDKDGLFHVQQM